MILDQFEFDDKDFEYIRHRVTQSAGIHLTEAKRELVYGRLSKRLRALELDSFKEYCEILKSGDTEEFARCVNAITTNVTSFFRENHHFEYLTSVILPDLVKKNENTSKPELRIWSAGCSSGEEPYSIAIAIKEYSPTLQNWNIKILATDLNSEILDIARTGIYKVQSIENTAIARRNRWFRKGVGANDGFVRIMPEIREMVHFRKLNLTGPWPIRKPFDIIFCRNVVIYFNNETRRNLINRFVDLLKDDGHLFVGHSESLLGVTDRLKSVGRTIHKKLF